MAWAGHAAVDAHRFRVTAATRIRKEFGLEAARVVLGHQLMNSTEIYAEVDRTKAADIMTEIG